MKNRNERLILKIIKENMEISRADIAEKAGLSAATVTNIVNDLMENHLIKESEFGKSKGGRRPVYLKLNGEGIKVIGIEWAIGSIKYAVVNLEGEVEKQGKIQIDNLNLGNFIKNTKKITNSIFNQIEKNNIKGIGIGIHGIVDPIKGISRYAPHFDWSNKNIVKKLKQIYDIPIKIDNDVRMMARAERWNDNRNFIFIHSSRGIGSAINFNNDLIYGKNFLAGEIGHTIVKADGPKCSCGNKGCLESMVSRQNILDYASEHLDLNIDNWSRLSNIINDKEKDTDKILKYISKYYGIALVNIINLLNPDEIILGGDLIDIKDILYPYLLQCVTENSLNKNSDITNIKFTKYNKIAGAVGAGFSILEKYFDEEEDKR